jgi:capsular exopolysaccharide synthesis family protein
MKNDDLIININPKSMFSESIKNIRTNLQFSSVDKQLKIILNTSPEAGDGKSFISANLAIAYAQEGKKVLIIDCDLRRGRQHTIFNVENPTDGGYSNLILNYKEEIKMSRYVVNTKMKNIDLIPTGPTPPNPIELLSSKSNEELIGGLKKHYDIIILDCPPILGISDTSVMLKYSDANLVVVSSGKTQYELLERAKKTFETANSKITGVVINKANVRILPLLFLFLFVMYFPR